MFCIDKICWRAGTLGTAIFAVLMASCASRPNTQAHAVPVDSGSYAVDADREIANFQAALSAMNGNQLDEAARRFRAIAKSRPEFAGPWVNLALIDVRQNRLDDAAKNAAEALKRNPRSAQAQGVLGFVAAAQGDVKKALDHYRRAVEIKKDYAVAHYNIALINDLYLNDMATAATHYRQYLAATDGGDKKTADWLAEIERSLGQAK